MGCGSSIGNLQTKQPISKFDQQQIQTVPTNNNETHTQHPEQTNPNIKHEETQPYIDKSVSKEIEKTKSEKYEKQLQQKLVDLLDDKDSILLNESQKKEMINAIKILEKMQFNVDEILGKGYYGVVVSVSLRGVKSVRMAVKLLFYNIEGENVFNKNDMSEEKYQKMRSRKEKSFIQEVEAMKKFNVPNIIKLYEYQEKDDIFFIFMEQCQYTLFQFLQQQKDKPIQQESNFVTWNQLIIGMEKLHEKDIVMRDLKDDNILIDDQGTLKYCDFGLCKDFSIKEVNQIYQQSQMRGNMLFQPPEILKIAFESNTGEDDLSKSENKSFKLIQDKSGDVWALGLIFYLLAGGKKTFLFTYGLSDQTYSKAPHVNDEVNNFIVSILQRDSSKRPTITEVRQNFNKLILGQAEKMGNPSLFSAQILQTQFTNQQVIEQVLNNDTTILIPNPFKPANQNLQNQQVESTSSNSNSKLNKNDSGQKLLNEQNKSQEKQDNQNQIQKQEQEQEKKKIDEQSNNKPKQVNENNIQPIIQNNNQQILNYDELVAAAQSDKNYSKEDSEKHYLLCIQKDPNDKFSCNNLGILYMNEFKNFEKAEEFFFKAIKIDSKYSTGLTNLGSLYRRYLQNFDKAEKYYQQALQADPKHFNAAFGLGLLYQNDLQKYQLSEKYYKQALDIDQNDLNSHQNIAILYKNNLNRYGDAEKHLLIALKIDSNNHSLFYNLGHLKLLQKLIQESELNFKKALDLKSDHYFSLLQLGVIYMDHDVKPNLSEKYFKEALKADPQASNPLFNLGQLYLFHYKDSKQAKSYYELYLKKEPTSHVAYHNLALCFEEESYFQEAEKCYLKAIELNNEFYNSYYNLGVLYKNEFNDPNKSIQFYTKALNLKPEKNIQCHFGLAISYNQLNNNHETENHYLKVLHYDPNYYSANKNLAILYNDTLKDYKLAEKYYKKCLELKPEEYNSNYFIAQLYESNLNDFQKAEEYYLKAIVIDPNQFNPYFRIGQMNQFNVKDYKKAVKFYQKALIVQPNDYLANYNLGIIYRDELKNFADAEKYLKLACTINPQKVNPIYSLGQLYQHNLKDYKLAEQFYLKAIEVDSNHKNSYFQLAYIYQNIIKNDEMAQKYRAKAQQIPS